MARLRTLIAFGLASTMMIGAPAFAVTQQHSATTTAAAKPAARMAAKPAVMTPARTTAATPAKPRTATPARSNTHLAKATLRNGKQVTYNCSLAGNKTKQACKS